MRTPSSTDAFILHSGGGGAEEPPGAPGGGRLDPAAILAPGHRGGFWSGSAVLAPLLSGRPGGRRQQRQVVCAGAAPMEWEPAQAVGILQRCRQPAAPALRQQQDAQQGQDGEGGEDDVLQEKATLGLQGSQGGCGLAQEAGPQHEAQPGPPAESARCWEGGGAWGLWGKPNPKVFVEKVLLPILEQILFFSLGNEKQAPPPRGCVLSGGYLNSAPPPPRASVTSVPHVPGKSWSEAWGWRMEDGPEPARVACTSPDHRGEYLRSKEVAESRHGLGGQEAQDREGRHGPFWQVWG